MNWLQYKKHGKWHAWPVGGQRTMCGHINIEHLRNEPAKEIHLGPELDTSYVRCAACLHHIRRTNPALAARLNALPGASGNAEVNAWLGIIRRHLTRVRGQLSEKNTQAIAQRLATIGPPDNQQASEAYEQIRVLLLKPQVKQNKNGAAYHTFTGVTAALKFLPLEDPTHLQHILAATKIWQRITGRAMDRDKFHCARVIETMLAIPEADLEAYIKRQVAKGYPYFAAVFNPNSLERAQSDPMLRGAFSERNTEYWERTKDKVNILTDIDEEDDDKQSTTAPLDT